MMDLISEAAGGRVVDFNDEFFAPAANLIRVEAPVWREGEYTDRGKWMDGWETRRRREPGHDWCILALGIPGQIERVTIDTSHFTGNYPEQFSLWACGVGADDRLGEDEWSELLPKTALQGDSVAVFDVQAPRRVTHVRLNIHPDGGVARLRLEGRPIPSMDRVCPEGLTDLVSSIVGGEALEASDRHYSDPANLLRPTESAGMWDGWETRRRRGPGHDWVRFRLGLPGVVERCVLDTTHFKGNAPGWVSLELSDDGDGWVEVIDRAPVYADSVNDLALDAPSRASYARLSIHPDGGAARFRLLGRADQASAGAVRLDYLNSLFDAEARRFFRTACAATGWVARMVDERPFISIDSVLQSAQTAFEALSDDDWLEAFAGHPRIGERSDPLANREQAATAAMSKGVSARLAAANREYEDMFGFTYIVYATGKSAEEMLAIAKRRLGNTRSEEIGNAADEQRKITDTRLRRMLCQEDS
jgi:allantoicase